jgi:hypothetical protein
MLEPLAEAPSAINRMRGPQPSPGPDYWQRIMPPSALALPQTQMATAWQGFPGKFARPASLGIALLEGAKFTFMGASLDSDSEMHRSSVDAGQDGAAPT